MKIAATFSLLLALGCFGCRSSLQAVNSCDCCDTTYTSIKAANNCLLASGSPKTTVDNRLLLIAFVTNNIKANQKLGWNIIGDNQIINIAKRQYLLVTLDANNFQGSTELSELIAKYKNTSFFVITNQSLYPFGSWTTADNKEFVISQLVTGNGP
ncbi:hypothetical protein [Hymenobacter properus]|uniref:Uncharacterized protein n=1 Tax=Hymenobacter properus TaxID=2791026 RepID=A0A931BJC1_9BACT|nr:hypothetical protein [Hymenobacter properus]MBF9140530.1 hypothetical protein [Hymenobacter properus]MBR7719337.1 hypothetical protein [Microvirga sp. SRT04]